MCAVNEYCCPICGAKHLHEIFPQYSGRCVTSQMQFLDDLAFANRCCLGCGFIFNALGTRNRSAALYTKEQWKPKPQVMSFGKDVKGQQERAFDIFAEMYDFAPQGNILDFGAGTGRFLEYFHIHFPQWKLFGLEPGGGYAEHATRIPQALSYNTSYHETQLTEKMDIIVVMSVLEHVENPLQALHWIADNLADNGVALLQHPDFAHLPGDLFCVDHISKLTVPHTKALCAHAGLELENVREGQVLFTLRCRKAKPTAMIDVVKENLAIAVEAERVAKATVRCIGAAIAEAKSKGGKVAVFGTSPVGFMGQRVLGCNDAVTCFVDENPCTWGKEQDGIAIVGPQRMQELGISDLALAISPVYWQMVAEKMRIFPVRVHVPSLSDFAQHGGHEEALYPNFLTASSHGDTPQACLAHLKAQDGRP